MPYRTNNITRITTVTVKTATKTSKLENYASSLESIVYKDSKRVTTFMEFQRMDLRKPNIFPYTHMSHTDPEMRDKKKQQ